MDALDRWHIRGKDDDAYVMITDDQGCPVAARVYRFDAEWIIAQREAAFQAAQQQRQEADPSSGASEGEE